MAWEIVWTDRALARVQQLCDFAARRDRAAALELVDELFDGVEMLADHPRLGPRWRDGNDDLVRERVVGRYLIIYLIEPSAERVAILTVRHQREAPPTPDEI